MESESEAQPTATRGAIHGADPEWLCFRIGTVPCAIPLGRTLHVSTQLGRARAFGERAGISVGLFHGDPLAVVELAPPVDRASPSRACVVVRLSDGSAMGMAIERVEGVRRGRPTSGGGELLRMTTLPGCVGLLDDTPPVVVLDVDRVAAAFFGERLGAAPRRGA